MMLAYTRRGILAVTAVASTTLATAGAAVGRPMAPMKLSADDHFLIMQLINRFYYAIDHREPSDFASVFVTDGVFVVRDKNNRIEREIVGPAELEKLGVAFSPRHFISNFTIDPQRDCARVRFSILKIDIMADPGAIDVTADGDCVVRKIGNEWKLARFDHLFDIKHP